jgi:hypothetical protein
MNVKTFCFIVIFYAISLTPNGRRSFFSKKCSNRPFLAQKAKMEKEFYFWNFNRRILLETTRRTCEKSFKKVDRTDCEIITFEVQIKVFFHCAQQGQQTLTARGANFLNYATLSFCTISCTSC